MGIFRFIKIAFIIATVVLIPCYLLILILRRKLAGQNHIV